MAFCDVLAMKRWSLCALLRLHGESVRIFLGFSVLSPINCVDLLFCGSNGKLFLKQGIRLVPCSVYLNELQSAIIRYFKNKAISGRRKTASHFIDVTSSSQSSELYLQGVRFSSSLIMALWRNREDAAATGSW